MAVGYASMEIGLGNEFDAFQLRPANRQLEATHRKLQLLVFPLGVATLKNDIDAAKHTNTKTKPTKYLLKWSRMFMALSPTYTFDQSLSVNFTTNVKT